MTVVVLLAYLHMHNVFITFTIDLTKRFVHYPLPVVLYYVSISVQWESWQVDLELISSVS